MSAMPAPLEGIRVIEVDNWMAAPSAGAILADMGAEVIKIEPLGGDPMRNTGRPAKVDSPEASSYDYQFDVDNRGKFSVSLDLTKLEGVQLVQRLIANAQIFMCNLLPRRQAKFALDAASLLAINPALVHASLTGYGTTGPHAERPGYDVTAFFGRSGLYDAMREGDEGIVPMARPAQGDHTAGLAMVGAILGGLRVAERTGQGQAVETSLYETAIWTQATDYCVTVVDSKPVRRRDRMNMLSPTINRYPCGDNKWLVINMPQSSAWPVLCRALGCEEWLQDERFVDGKSRYKHMPELVRSIDAILSAKTRDEWGKIFDEHHVVWGTVLGLHETAQDLQAEAIGLFPKLHHPNIGNYRTVNSPMRFQHANVRPKGPAPGLGEHTYQVLRDVAGMNEADLKQYVDTQIIFASGGNSSLK